jgi:hypothetical protein
MEDLLCLPRWWEMRKNAKLYAENLKTRCNFNEQTEVWKSDKMDIRETGLSVE